LGWRFLASVSTISSGRPGRPAREGEVLDSACLLIFLGWFGPRPNRYAPKPKSNREIRVFVSSIVNFRLFGARAYHNRFDGREQNFGWLPCCRRAGLAPKENGLWAGTQARAGWNSIRTASASSEHGPILRTRERKKIRARTSPRISAGVRDEKNLKRSVLPSIRKTRSITNQL